MNITYLGHASFRFKFDSAVAVIDPFDPQKVGLKYPKQKADFVLISHDHFDHNYLTGTSGYRKVISGPGEYELSGVSIIGYSFFHDEDRGKKRGIITAYLIEEGDTRILHLGDLGHELTDEDVDKIGDVDAAMIPVGGEFTINSRQAVEIIRKIEPRIVLPMHYHVKGMDAQFSKLETVDSFVRELGLPTEKLDKLSVKPAEIEDEQKVVLLAIKS